MPIKSINTIDDVISSLDDIIDNAVQQENTLGYFAALYRQVTIKVKEGIANGDFENGPRMERLDVIFASRYIDAYYLFKDGQPITDSWTIAFMQAGNYWPIVLQHLLVGMNAHINLDLGIAAAEVSKGHDIDDLKADFDKINEILSSLVNKVQEDLAQIWPTLKKILKWTKKVDDFLVDFSMELARDGAWSFAKIYAGTEEHGITELVNNRDLVVASKAKVITNPGFIVRLLFGIIRLGERGSVSEKINNLQS